jgi:hypothetical protein
VEHENQRVKELWAWLGGFMIYDYDLFTVGSLKILLVAFVFSICFIMLIYSALAIIHAGAQLQWRIDAKSRSLRYIDIDE